MAYFSVGLDDTNQLGDGLIKYHKNEAVLNNEIGIYKVTVPNN